MMALEHLQESLTKGNLWIYILKVLEEGDATPSRIRDEVRRRYGFSPATITFYSVLYKLSREGLVKRKSTSFRSSYTLTDKGIIELKRGKEFLKELLRRIE